MYYRIGAGGRAAEVPASCAAPGIFTVLMSGSGPGAVLNQDNTLNFGTNPATRGSVIQDFCHWGGATKPPLLAGERRPSAAIRWSFTQVQPTVSIGGRPAQGANCEGEILGVRETRGSIFSLTPGAMYGILVLVHNGWRLAPMPRADGSAEGGKADENKCQVSGGGKGGKAERRKGKGRSAPHGFHGFADSVQTKEKRK